MDYIRDDGKIFSINDNHNDTINRLDESDSFKRLDNVTVEGLKDICREKEITGFSTMTRNELIEVLK